MTNKEGTEDEPSSCDPHFAAFLAVHLVKKVLDDAYVIANAAMESGQPIQSWHYQSTVKNVMPSETDEEDVSSKTESDIVNENKIEQCANMVATSTPQKVADDHVKRKPDTSLIGQGDGELEMHQIDLAKSTSMFINHLFDMSEVETVIMCDETQIIQSDSEPNDLLTQAMSSIMDTYVNNALGIAIEPPPQSLDDGIPIERLSSSEYSDYSFLSDAYDEYPARDIAFYIQDTDDTIGNTNNECEVPHLVPNVQISEINDEIAETMEKSEVTRYENAYLTLNRDYEQGSDDGNIILDDTKGMTLQEVQLLTANTSDENIASFQDRVESEDKCVQENTKELKATSAVSAASKKSIVNRCRSQGARLLACLRGWWRRRTPGRRKEQQQRNAGAVRGLCPLSPDARRRTASLIDQRLLRSPSPPRNPVWKFNTVNEAVVNSTHWKDYTFQVKPDECGEF